MFNQRLLLIVTKHQKERVISPLFEKAFRLKSRVSSNFDTDSMGTFTGEVERRDDALTTLRDKCLRAMDLEGSDLAVANEGSFGPHPQLIFTPVDSEMAIFIDKQNQIEIVASVTSMSTNFCGRFVDTYEDLLKFASDCHFPSHAMILRKDQGSKQDIFKGIVSEEQLFIAYSFLKNKYSLVFAETDMRALYNPSRMLVIESVFEKLISKINSVCPQCKTIGFDIIDFKTGLPCNQCGFKTRSVLAHLYQCKKCHHAEERSYPNSILTEDPMYCDICNP